MMQPAVESVCSSRVDLLFHALGDANRRRMVSHLAERPASVSELAAVLAISKTAIGQHLAVLEEAKLARSTKLGRVRTCQFDPAGLAPLQDWIDYHRQEWNERLNRLDDLISGIVSKEDCA
ncbi:metalloregulator ArsR/SmtB family transcription factor [Sphingomonas aerolata]|uniref:ArsR/SmtB family transcription factor n=1 Tax=Sphingomonas aerolata TaxID=185951 RepID=UPI002FE0399E